MISSSLKKYGTELGFENKNGRLFGTFQGYFVTLVEGMGYKKMMIGVTLSADDPLLNQIVGFIETNKKESKITEYSVHPSHISVSLQDSIGTMKRLKELLDKFVKLLTEIHVSGSSVCWYCKNSLSSNNADKLLINDAVVPMHEGCIESYTNTIESASDEFHHQQKNYLQGSFGALLGGIVGAIPWVIVYLLGYFVGILGYVIGFAAKKGYEILGGRPGKAKPWIVAVIVIFCILLGQFVAENIALYNLLRDEGITDFSLMDLPAFIIELIQYDPEYRGGMLADVGLGLLFALLGIYDLFKSLKKEGKGNISTVKKLD